MLCDVIMNIHMSKESPRHGVFLRLTKPFNAVFYITLDSFYNIPAIFLLNHPISCKLWAVVMIIKIYSLTKIWLYFTCCNLRLSSMQHLGITKVVCNILYFGSNSGNNTESNDCSWVRVFKEFHQSALIASDFQLNSMMRPLFIPKTSGRSFITDRNELHYYICLAYAQYSHGIVVRSQGLCAAGPGFKPQKGHRWCSEGIAPVTEHRSNPT